MKLKRTTLPNILGFFVLITFLLLCFHHTVIANEVRYVLNLVFYPDAELKPQNNVNVRIKIWRITDQINNQGHEENQKKIVKELASLSERALDQEYEQYTIEGRDILTSDEKGTFILNNLKDGYYYVRELSFQPDGYRAIPFVFAYPNEFDVVFVKRTKGENPPPDIPTGRQRFQKIASDTKEPLAGATFKLMQNTAEGTFNYLREGKIGYYTSDANGIFEVSGLPKGNYLLWEVAPPEGYSQLKHSISFSINGKDENNSIILIENKPKKYEKDLPDTGDMLFYIILGGGLLLFLIGRYLISEQKNNL